MTEIVILVSAKLEKIFPSFLERQRIELQNLRASYEKLDYGEMKNIGHRMKGTCGSYGLGTLGDLGGVIERTADEHDARALGETIQSMEDHFSRLKIEFKKNQE